jgi:putative aldouronate transport system permease protein
VLSASFSNEQELYKFGYMLWPKTVDFTAYKYVFANPQQMIDSYAVTIQVTIIGTIASLFCMTMCAYALSRNIFKYRKAINFYVYFTMLFNGGLVPSYILNTQYYKLGNSIWVLILPVIISPFYVFLMRSFICKLPSALIESAKIDGASEFRVLRSIIIPLSTPVIATVGFFMALGKWNDWYSGLLYIQKDELLPLQTLLQRILANLQFMTASLDNIPANMNETIKIPGETIRMAMLVVATGPMLFVFPFVQKYFSKGLTIGAVKE